MTLAYRFGLSKMVAADSTRWLDSCRRAEAQGYDIVLVPDHLGTAAPFSAAVAAAQATGLRVGTYALNAAFYRTALLAREVATASALTAGRFELGVGTGYLRAEFEAVGLDPGSPGDRVGDLTRILTGLGERTNESRSTPVLVAGNGDRVLRLAATHADIVSFLGMRYDPTVPGGLRPLTTDEFATRVAFFDAAAGARSAAIERNIAIRAVLVTDDRAATLRTLARTRFRLPVEILDDLPILLVGTVEQIADRIEQLRDRFGITYFAIPDLHQEAFAPVLDKLR
ncbi:TIGR03621 family F420-dependent LLM class oxidoreductase [Nocardia sp. CA-135953]|uniref:TIGR03621 family F420-dependent LLM class oxidoreductase n=1 Tax=Nocardia sp. CA-135953 TaxID=3239978 RepID=UPI003D9545A3